MLRPEWARIKELAQAIHNEYIQEEVFNFLEGHAQALLAEDQAEPDDQ